MHFSFEYYSKYLLAKLVDQIAKENSFMTRNKSVKPHIFLDTLLNPALNILTNSFSEISMDLSKKDIHVSRQSIFEKLNSPCVLFLQAILKTSLETVCQTRKLLLIPLKKLAARQKKT